MASHVRLLEVVLGDVGIEVIGTAPDGEKGVEVVAALQPELVVMDLDMPGIDGLEATRRIKDRFPDIDVVAFTATEDPRVRFEFRAAGASAVFLKGDHYELREHILRRAA